MMATLGSGTVLRLRAPLDGYSRSGGSGLATQVAAGRHLRLLEGAPGPTPGPAAAEGCSEGCSEGNSQGRLRVRLLEDGYPCWLNAADLARLGEPALAPALPRLDRPTIEARLEAVLAFALAAEARPNRYLWGGSLGPDYDCSGLVQTAFASQGIWLPRDAYLQERFCRPVAVRPGDTALLQPGDLIFFGTPQRCTHVALHLGGGRYLHSSGPSHGRDGIGRDDLNPRNGDPVACHYRAELRGAGRVMHSHDGSPLPA